MREALSREEVFRFVAEIGAAALGGEKSDFSWAAGKLARPEDVADASSDFARRVAERFDHIPEALPDDVSLEVREAVRVQLDTIMSDLAKRIEEALRRQSGG